MDLHLCVLCKFFFGLSLSATIIKVQKPRRKMQVALLAEPKTPPGVESVYLIL